MYRPTSGMGRKLNGVECAPYASLGFPRQSRHSVAHSWRSRPASWGRTLAVGGIRHCQSGHFRGVAPSLEIHVESAM